MRIDVGGGLESREGYLNIDRYANIQGVRADCLYLPFPDNSIEAVNTSHYLEHIEKRAVVPQLKEIYRVLYFGCPLHIEVPSLVWCVENWLEHLDGGWNLDTIFGNQDPPGGQFHYTGFTHEIMIGYLREAGFKNITIGEVWSHSQQCLTFETER